MLYVIWKHGFVRADQHVVIFFQFISVNIFLVLALIFILDNKNIFSINFLKKICISMCVLIPILGISVSKRQFPNKWFYENVKENAVKFSSLILIKKHFKLIDKKINIEKSKVQLYKIQNIVKDKTIGYFGLHME